MIKKQQKWIALLVTLTFVWLLQVSAMPIAAANAEVQMSAAGNEQGPRYIEEEGNSGNLIKKKSILPYVLIGVGVVAVAAVLFLVVLKTSDDIRGTWTVHITYDGDDYEWDTTPVFTGDKKSGTTTDNWSGTGTYTVDGKNVTFSLHWPNNNTSTFTGQFDTKDTMSGRFHETAEWDGDWTAVRVASGASLPAVKNLAEKRGPNS